MNCVSRNRRLPWRTRLRPSSCSQPHKPQSTTHETSTTLRELAMRARSVKRLMERATIHSGVGGINGLRLIHLLSRERTAIAPTGDTPWHGGWTATRMRLRPHEREVDRVVVEVCLV